MPIPKPKKNESQDKFIGRCMSSDLMKKEFPDSKQRAAVCFDSWRKGKHKMKYEVINFSAPVKWQDVETEELDEGLLIKGIPIFKVGTYRDIKYTEKYIDEKILGAFKAEENVPVQADHSESYEKTLGYIQNLQRKGKMLLADMHLLADNAIARWKRGLMKKWSASIYIDGGLREVSAVAFPFVREASILSDGDNLYKVTVKNKVPDIKKEVINIEVEEDINLSDLDPNQGKQDSTNTNKNVLNKNKKPDEGEVTDMDEKKIDELAELKAQKLMEEAGEREEEAKKRETKLEDEVKAEKEKAEKLAAEKVELEKSLKEKEVREKVAELKAEGRILPAEEKQVVAFSLKLDEEAQKEYFGMLKKAEKKVDLNESGEQESNKDGDTKDEYKIDLDEASAEEVEALVDKYAKKEGIPVDDARDILFDKNEKKEDK